jgi:hypothetical protein
MIHFWRLFTRRKTTIPRSITIIGNVTNGDSSGGEVDGDIDEPPYVGFIVGSMLSVGSGVDDANFITTE